MTASDKGLLRQPSIKRQLVLNSLPDNDVSLSLTADLTAFHQQFDRFSLSLLIVSVVLVSIITLFSLLLSRRVFMPFESLHKTLLYRASHDDLTGLHNRVTINEQLGIKISEAQRNNSGFFVALLDIDHFKRINDNYGHSAGDTILREVATRLKQTLRDYDVVGRYGGEEFIVFAADDLAGCKARLLRLKQAISKDSFNSKNQDIKLTISIGACFVDFQQCEARVSSATLIEVADQALYKAKSEGRNRVVIQSHDNELFARKILN
jgi:diguanylate cyclase (GGDEF)-like protein